MKKRSAIQPKTSMLVTSSHDKRPTEIEVEIARLLLEGALEILKNRTAIGLSAGGNPRDR